MRGRVCKLQGLHGGWVPGGQGTGVAWGTRLALDTGPSEARRHLETSGLGPWGTDAEVTQGKARAERCWLARPSGHCPALATRPHSRPRSSRPCSAAGVQGPGPGALEAGQELCPGGGGSNKLGLREAFLGGHRTPFLGVPEPRGSGHVGLQEGPRGWTGRVGGCGGPSLLPASLHTGLLPKVRNQQRRRLAAPREGAEVQGSVGLGEAA